MFLLIAAIALLSGYQYGGTFIAAIICQDGIVVAADSRMTFMDTNGRAFAYFDGLPKIYADRGSAVAVSGMTSVEGELFSSFVDRNHFLLGRAVNEILFGFALWLPYTNSNNVGLISAGFLDGKAMICSKSPILPQRCSGSGFISNKVSPVLRDSLATLGHTPTTAEAAAALKTAIEDYSRTDTTVGGPVSVLKLTMEKAPEWLTAPLSDGGLTKICDLVRDHRAGRRRITPLVGAAEFDQYLRGACPN
jgi:hypothetical protein